MIADASLTDPSQHVFWLTSRALGIIAMLLVSVSVGLGLALSGRLGSKPGAAARFKTLHEATALLSLFAIAGHGALLIGDPYLHPGLKGVLLPFAMEYEPLWTGLGVISGWLALILGLSFYARNWIGVAVWRWLHRWTLLVYALGIVHTVGSGTDSAQAWLVAMLSLAAVPVVFAGTARMLPRAKKAPRKAADASGPPALRAAEPG